MTVTASDTKNQISTDSPAGIPDYEATRERTLKKLKVGRQSTAGKAIDAFIKELGKLSPNTQHPMPNAPNLGNLAVNLLVDLAVKRQKQHQTDNRYFDDLRYIAGICGYQLFHTSKGYQAKDLTTSEFVFTTSELGGVASWLRSLSPNNNKG